MSESDLSELLRQIRQAGADACIFVEGMGQEDFIDDKRTHQAVIMSLTIIGEAVARIANKRPEFVSAHGYFELDLGIVWATVQKDVPDLLTKLSW